MRHATDTFGILKARDAYYRLITPGKLRNLMPTAVPDGPGGQVRLTPTECAILKLLMGSPGQVITKSLLLDRIALDTPDCTETSLKMHVSNLRRKLREAGAGDCIEAVWGIGFRLREAAP